jgi:hypothetical protein
MHFESRTPRESAAFSFTALRREATVQIPLFCTLCPEFVPFSLSKPDGSD